MKRLFGKCTGVAATVFFLAGCVSLDSLSLDVFKKDAEAAAEQAASATIPVYTADAGVEGFAFDLPAPAQGTRWAQAGGATTHAPGNPALAPVPESAWEADIGEGSGSQTRLLASPLVVDGVVYAQDAEGQVSAYALEKGERLWRVETVPGGTVFMGGGIAWESGVLFATTGAGEVVALRSADGTVLWRRGLGKPLRSAPTIADGRVFVITLENETHVLDAQTGRPLWRHTGFAESAALLGASSPAVRGDMVVLPYSSGEIFGLRTQNGRLAWTEVLAVPRRTGALPSIADIRGLPVLDGKQVFAISHSGRFVAIDERTGNRVWEREIGGINTPCVIGNGVFVVTNDGALVAMTRQDGRIVWSTPLQTRRDPSEKDSKAVAWFGPVMAGGRLWVTSSGGSLAAFDPETGFALYDREIAKAFFLPPVVAEGVMALLDDDGILRVLR